ncbi:MAG: hypothetical protein LBL33_01715 [Tannerella sp.]|jgi:hypothetical protein|nr:hypothetical protein [Tannerella sp.]
MKKFNLFLVVALFCATGLTSCLEGENKSQGYDLGVLDYSFTAPVMKTFSYAFYGPELVSLMAQGTLELGGCYYFQYTIDYDLPENSEEMVKLNGYYTVSIVPLAEAQRFYPNSYLTDTLTLLTNELPVADILLSEGGLFGYAENYLFVTHSVNHEKDLDVQWDMSYEDNDNVMTEENGKRQYNLFVRATSKTARDESKAAMEYSHFNAYYLRDFLESAARTEKERLGSSYNNTSSTFTVKFNYVSGINEDSEITWQSKSVDIFISMLIQE